MKSTHTNINSGQDILPPAIHQRALAINWWWITKHISGAIIMLSFVAIALGQWRDFPNKNNNSENLLAATNFGGEKLIMVSGKPKDSLQHLLNLQPNVDSQAMKKIICNQYRQKLNKLLAAQADIHEKLYQNKLIIEGEASNIGDTYNNPQGEYSRHQIEYLIRNNFLLKSALIKNQNEITQLKIYYIGFIKKMNGNPEEILD